MVKTIGVKLVRHQGLQPVVRGGAIVGRVPVVLPQFSIMVQFAPIGDEHYPWFEYGYVGDGAGQPVNALIELPDDVSSTIVASVNSLLQKGGMPGGRRLCNPVIPDEERRDAEGVLDDDGDDDYED